MDLTERNQHINELQILYKNYLSTVSAKLKIGGCVDFDKLFKIQSLIRIWYRYRTLTSSSTYMSTLTITEVTSEAVSFTLSITSNVLITVTLEIMVSTEAAMQNIVDLINADGTAQAILIDGVVYITSGNIKLVNGDVSVINVTAGSMSYTTTSPSITTGVITILDFLNCISYCALSKIKTQTLKLML